jgi:hypothetical protein
MQPRPFGRLRLRTLELHPLFPTILDTMTINPMGTECPWLDRVDRHDGVDHNAEEIDQTIIEGRLGIIDT